MRRAPPAGRRCCSSRPVAAAAALLRRRERRPGRPLLLHRGAALAGFQWPLALAHWLADDRSDDAADGGDGASPRRLPQLPRSGGAGDGGCSSPATCLVWLAAAPLYPGWPASAAHVAGRRRPSCCRSRRRSPRPRPGRAAPPRKRALRPLPQDGAAAAVGLARPTAPAFAFGLDHGRSCLASCWALMLVPAGCRPPSGADAGGRRRRALAERRLPRGRPERGRRSAGGGRPLPARAAAAIA